MDAENVIAKVDVALETYLGGKLVVNDESEFQVEQHEQRRIKRT